MIRNLKVLIAAAMALTAFGAISASGAQAAEFHCSVDPCTVTIQPDGDLIKEPKTAHHVFIFKQGANQLPSFTCNQLTGDATFAKKTTNTLTFGTLMYHHCTTSGQNVASRMNGCEYHFVTPGTTHNASAQVKCPEGKVIEFEIEATKCLITIGTTAVLGGGLKLHDPKTGGIAKDIVTAELTLSNISITFNDKCPAPIVKGAGTGEYTTGNVELTGETQAGVHANLWWTV